MQSASSPEKMRALGPPQGNGGESRLIDALAPLTGRRFFSTFKNRILISTLLVMIGGVIAIGAILQIAVFPKLEADPAVIVNLKMIHLFASLLVVAISWLFIEKISKRITLPLQELTKRADQISREAGPGPLPGARAASNGNDAAALYDVPHLAGDEIEQLRVSFYRMLAHLKASQARLIESEKKYRFLFDNAPSPLFVLDAEEMSILDVNAGAVQEYGYTRDEFLGMSFWDLGCVRGRDDSDVLSVGRVDPDASASPVFQHKRKDGSCFLLHLQSRFTLWNDQPAMIAAAWDVTEKLEKEAQLAQTGKMATLGEMAAGIAHELNQPLNVIKIGSDYLTKCIRMGRDIPRDDLKRTAEELSSNVDRAARIIGHLRDFGRKSEGSMRDLDINAPVRGVFALLGTQLEKIGINFELSLDDRLPKILGDANRLEQVFINLVINAKDAMVQHDRDCKSRGLTCRKDLKVKSSFEKNQVVVTVSDSGPGVPPRLRTRIFEPFFTTKRVGEGTGIGLSISYGIVKEHGGVIEVIDSDQNGAVFRLAFPPLDIPSETNHDKGADN